MWKASPAPFHLTMYDRARLLKLQHNGLAVFQDRMPGIRTRYREINKLLMDHYPKLELPYPGSSFAATTVNIGPQAVAHSHTDWGNIAWGTCTDSPFGSYDWTRGGQLILHEPKLILELRPGDVALFPSACIEHENLPIQKGETRYSVVSYTAGALFQHYDHGFQTLESWREEDPAAAARHDRLGEQRWMDGMALYKRR